jgi:hypothetical protein
MAALDMVDIYRPLVGTLKEKFGGTIDDVNAEAIAVAAAQVYRREVEPRLWEEKSAHELLDVFGVPRAGDFVSYSLRDRLLLFRRRNGTHPYVEQAHQLLDDLHIPRHDEAGRDCPLRVRLDRLLGSLNLAPPAGPANNGDEGAGGAHEDRLADGSPPAGEADGGRRVQEGGAPAAEEAPENSAGDGDVGPELVDALEAIQRAAGEVGEDDEPLVSPPEAGGVDVVGLWSLLGTVEQEVVELRQTVESLRQELRDAVSVFQGGPPPLPAPAASDVADAPQSPEAAQTPEVPEASETPEPSGAYDVTRVVPPVAVPAGPAPEEAAEAPGPAERPHRSRRIVLLVLLVILIGLLLAAGITAAVVLGWDQLQSRFDGIVTLAHQGGYPPW